MQSEDFDLLDAHKKNIYRLLSFGNIKLEFSLY